MTLFQIDKDAGTIVSAVYDSTYEDYMAVNHFLGDLPLRALNNYEDGLPKAEDELPGGESYVNDLKIGNSRKLQQCVQQSAKKKNVVLTPLEVPIQPPSLELSAAIILMVCRHSVR